MTESSEASAAARPGAEESVQDGSIAGDTAWHALDPQAVFQALDTSENGLSASEAARRLEAHGPNEIRDESSVSPLSILVAQFRHVLIYLLVVAAGLSLAVGALPGQEPNYVDAGLILLILLGNGLFGFVQDYRAERSMERLRELSTPEATVIRDGTKTAVSSTALVPGDVVVLEQGDAVPADARLVEARSLETAEATLTGESASVTKSADAVDDATPLAERTDMVYMNTNVVGGRGVAVVVATGMETEVGSIATQIQSAEDDETPFQHEIDRLGRRIGYGVVGLIGLVVVVQLTLTMAGAITVLLTAITLAVAAVPEGLPAVVTLTLALGAQRMADRNALVRRLPVVQGLGSVDVILTDKTGTLTENQMTVTRLAANEKTYDVSGSGLAPEGEFSHDGTAVAGTQLDALLRCGLVCNDAELATDAAGDRTTFGDPTEVALLVSARKAGIEDDSTRVDEVPFSADRKRMTVVVTPGANGGGVSADAAGGGGDRVAYMKGAPEVVVDRCTTELVDGEVRPLTETRRSEIAAQVDSFASDALRVLAFARRDGVGADAAEGDEAIEREMTFLGLQGMIDPPRSEVPAAVADCRRAGIRVVMATGDNLETAKAIGAQIGFDPAGALTGSEFETLDEADLRSRVERVEVFARMTPEHKVRVLSALQSNGHTVAMTGDGVNDAPGVRNADVGIAMGRRGTDVTKEASDMVLRDDNFASIRDAVAEGRSIFDNVQKFVTLLLSANAAEVVTVFVGVLIGSLLFPTLFAANAEALILTPVMLLWINLVTDGLPALALGVDPGTDDVLDRDPRSSEDGVIDRHVALSIVTIGLTMTAFGLVVFFESLVTFESLVRAQTALFTFFVVAEMGIIQVIRRRFGQSVFENRWLVAAVIASLSLQLVVLYTPLSTLFDVFSLTGADWLRIAVAVVAVIGVNAALDELYTRRFDDRSG